MTIDKAYYNKVIRILTEHSVNGIEADTIATTLSTYIPMLFIPAHKWADLDLDDHPVNAVAAACMEYLDTIPELKKAIIYKMPTSSCAVTTYGQRYVPGTDSPVYTTGADGYTHCPYVDWKDSIAGPHGERGNVGHEPANGKQLIDPEWFTRLATVDYELFTQLTIESHPEPPVVITISTKWDNTPPGIVVDKLKPFYDVKLADFAKDPANPLLADAVRSVISQAFEEINRMGRMELRFEHVIAYHVPSEANQVVSFKFVVLPSRRGS